LGLAIGRVLDLEPVLAILTIHSGLALGDNSFEVPSADFREQCASSAYPGTPTLSNSSWRSDKIMAEILSKPLAAKQVLTRSFFECKTF
jgi:hypothetical protein